MSDSELIVLFVTFGCVSNYKERTYHMKTATIRIGYTALTYAKSSLISRYPRPYLVGMT